MDEVFGTDKARRGEATDAELLRGKLDTPTGCWTRSARPKNACLATPNRLAMSCQDQPLARALSTCRASSTSARPRKAATARRPISGSWLAVAAANVVTWLLVASSIASIYLDKTRRVNAS